MALICQQWVKVGKNDQKWTADKDEQQCPKRAKMGKLAKVGKGENKLANTAKKRVKTGQKWAKVAKKNGNGRAEVAKKGQKSPKWAKQGKKLGQKSSTYLFGVIRRYALCSTETH